MEPISAPAGRPALPAGRPASAALAQVLARDLLHLIVMPTEACNFRCTYCYEDFRLGRMPEEIVGGVERFLSRRAGRLGTLDISWFGGEPLLAPDIVLRLLRHVGELRDRHASLVFRSDMTTNGYRLTPDLFIALHALGVTRYQVSFDGPPESHDLKRVRRSGRGSFARIWENLLGIRALPLQFTVRMRLHIDRDVSAARAFVEKARREFQGDERFPLFPRLLADWRCAGDDSGSDRVDGRGVVGHPAVNGPDRGGGRGENGPDRGGGRGENGPDRCGRSANLLAGAAGQAALESIKSFAAAIGVPVASPAGDAICYAARGNSFLIRADGRVNKCTIALNDPANAVGHLAGDGRLILDARSMAPWMRGLWTGSPEALHCPMAGLVPGRPE